MARTATWRAFLAVLAIGTALRFLAIHYGLPQVFNSDEPHLVNVAVSFGGGSLNPHLFKYPTLWMYLLFIAYGAYFAAWSCLGIRAGIGAFGEMFVRDPTGFYLIARMLAAALSAAALERVYRTGREQWGERAGLLAATTLAVAPSLVIAAHAAKPESLMFFLAAWAWWFAARYFREGRRRDLVLAGAVVGLAASAQYTGAPLGSLLFAAWAGRRIASREPWSRDLETLGWSLAACAGGFFGGSPFILLDFSTFRAFVADQGALGAVKDAVGLATVLKLLVSFSGTVWAAGAAMLAGFALLARRSPGEAVWLGIPCLAYVLTLSRMGEGDWQRYLFWCFPGAALAAGYAASRLLDVADKRMRRGAAAAGLVVALAFCLPGGLESWVADREFLAPDTRTEAAAWVAANIPEGAAILMDQEHASPRVAVSKAMAERLLEQTEKLGHPRRKFYQLMLNGHPGGGYDVYRVERTYKSLHTLPGHMRFSEQGQMTVDAREGVSVLRGLNIGWVVLTSYGAALERDPELAKFFQEVESQGRLMAEFTPQAGVVAGPRLRIFKLELNHANK